MKKALFTLTLLAVVTLMSAQTLQFEHNGHVYENGETIISPYNEDFFEYITDYLTIPVQTKIRRRFHS